MATWSLGHSLMATLPLCLVHVFPIVLPWLLVCIYSPPPCSSYSPTNASLSPQLLVSVPVPVSPVSSLIVSLSSLSRSVVPLLVVTPFVLVATTQCGPYSSLTIPIRPSVSLSTSTFSHCIPGEPISSSFPNSEADQRVPTLRAPPSSGGKVNSRSPRRTSRPPLPCSGLTSGTASETRSTHWGQTPIYPGG